jgi:hypothetical protein
MTVGELIEQLDGLAEDVIIVNEAGLEVHTLMFGFDPTRDEDVVTLKVD